MKSFFGFPNIKKGWEKRYEESLNVNKILVLLSFSHSLLKCYRNKNIHVQYMIHKTKSFLYFFPFDFVLAWTRFQTKRRKELFNFQRNLIPLKEKLFMWVRCVISLISLLFSFYSNFNLFMCSTINIKFIRMSFCFT